MDVSPDLQFALGEIQKQAEIMLARKNAAVTLSKTHQHNGWYFTTVNLKLENDFVKIKVGYLRKIETLPLFSEITTALEDKGIIYSIGRYCQAISYEICITGALSEKASQTFAWAFSSLLRIKTASTFLIPFSSNSCWPCVAALEPDSLHIKVLEDTGGSLKLGENPVVTNDDVTWADNNWESFIDLTNDERFKLASDAFTTFNHQPNLRLAIAHLWSGIEALFGIQSELRFRLSAVIACILEERGPKRFALHSELKKLYDVRSKAVHGSQIKPIEMAQHLQRVREIFSAIMQRFITSRKLPSVAEFEEMVFL